MKDYPENLREAEAHLGAAISQSVPTDDQIIKEHMVAAHALLEAYRKEFESMARQPELQSLHYEGGETNIAMRHPIVAYMALELAAFFKDAGGTNYVGLEFRTEDLGDMVLTVQRKLGKTPHQLRSEVEGKLAALQQSYRWRPIAEIHEDHGACVVLRVDDPGSLAVMSCLDENFDSDDWTHFAEVPKLTNEEAERLKGGDNVRPTPRAWNDDGSGCPIDGA